MVSAILQSPICSYSSDGANDWDDQLDKDWPMYHQMKVERLADRGEKAVQTLPEAREAAWELCQDLCEFLSRVYPQVYRIRRSGRDNKGWYGSGSIVSVEMPSLGASYDLMKDDSLTVSVDSGDTGVC